MKKINILASSRDFEKIIKKNKPYFSPYFKLYITKNETNIYKVGIAVPKTLGNAVIRNKIKRQIKNILDNNKKLLHLSYNYIIIVRKDVLKLNFNKIEIELINLLNKERKYNETKYN